MLYRDILQQIYRNGLKNIFFVLTLLSNFMAIALPELRSIDRQISISKTQGGWLVQMTKP